MVIYSAFLQRRFYALVPTALTALMVLCDRGICQELSATKTAAIAQQIADAVAAGAHQVKIQPGIYGVMPGKPKQTHLVLHDLRALEIDARGVTLLCSNLSSALEMRNCQDLTLRGLTIDYDPLPMTQGTIVGFAPDRTWTDVRIHKGYPLPTLNASNCPNGQGFFWIHDGKTRLLKAGTANRFVRDIIPQGNGVYRLDHGKAQFRDRAEIGDFIRIPQKYESATGVNIYGCKNLTLTEVTLLSAPPHYGMAVRYCEGMTFRKVQVIPGPPPTGATEPRLFSTVGDGINCGGITGGLIIEDCDLNATGDDGIAVYSEPGLVLRATGENRLTVSFGNPGHPAIMPGTRLRLFSETTGGIEEAVIVSSATTNMPRAEIEAVRNRAIQHPYSYTFLSALNLKLDKPVHAREGDQIELSDEVTQEFIIRDNRINNAGSRGIVANRSFGRVEGNRVTHTYLPGIHVFAFFRSEGGPGSQDRLRISNNQVEDTCAGWPNTDGWQGAISVVNWDGGARSFGGHHDIRIEDNQITRAWGVNVQVQCASGIAIRGNRFCQSHLLSVKNGGPRPVDNGALIFLQNAQDVTIADNQIIEPGPYLKTPLTCIDVQDLKQSDPFGKTAK